VAALGLNAAGASKWEFVERRGGLFWKSDEVEAAGDWQLLRATQATLLKKAQATGELVDGPVYDEMDFSGQKTRFWLEIPKALRPLKLDDVTLVKREPRQGVRFYFRGDAKAALQHLKDVAAEVQATGRVLSDKVWVTPLSLWRNSPNYLAEYWVELKS
jgi:hypothetical protein